MYPKTELENYKLQVELLQEKLRRSEVLREHLEEKFDQLIAQRNEREKQNSAKNRSKLKKFLKDQQERNERNKALVRRLEHIDEQAAALAARSERFKMLKMHYDFYFTRMMQTHFINSMQGYNNILKPLSQTMPNNENIRDISGIYETEMTPQNLSFIAEKYDKNQIDKISAFRLSATDSQDNSMSDICPYTKSLRFTKTEFENLKKINEMTMSERLSFSNLERNLKAKINIDRFENLSINDKTTEPNLKEEDIFNMVCNTQNIDNHQSNSKKTTQNELPAINDDKILEHKTKTHEGQINAEEDEKCKRLPEINALQGKKEMTKQFQEKSNDLNPFQLFDNSLENSVKDIKLKELMLTNNGNHVSQTLDTSFKQKIDMDLNLHRFQEREKLPSEDFLNNTYRQQISTCIPDEQEITTDTYDNNETEMIQKDVQDKLSISNEPYEEKDLMISKNEENYKYYDEQENCINNKDLSQIDLNLINDSSQMQNIPQAYQPYTEQSQPIYSDQPNYNIDHSYENIQDPNYANYEYQMYSGEDMQQQYYDQGQFTYANYPSEYQEQNQQLEQAFNDQVQYDQRNYEQEYVENEYPQTIDTIGNIIEETNENDNEKQKQTEEVDVKQNSVIDDKRLATESFREPDHPVSILSTSEVKAAVKKKKKRVNFVDSETDESSSVPNPDIQQPSNDESDFDFSLNQ